MGIIKSVFRKKESSGVVDIDIFEPDVNTERISDTESQADEDDHEEETPNEDVPALSTIERIKLELECPVCHEIPIKLPIPCCPEGHLLCHGCKDSIVKINQEDWNEWDDEEYLPLCPICRTEIGENFSVLASSLVSILDNIPCSKKLSGCSFTGTLDQLKNHRCLYQLVSCLVCDKKVRRIAFFGHNSGKCLLTDDNNKFSYPDSDRYLLVQDGGLDVFVSCKDLGSLSGVERVFRMKFRFGPESSDLGNYQVTKMTITIENLKDIVDKTIYSFNLQKIPVWTSQDFACENFVLDGRKDGEAGSWIIHFAFH